MNSIINRFVNSLPFEIHLYDPYVGKYSACGPGTKHKERIEKYKRTGDLNIIYKNPLDKACFYHDSGYAKYKDVENRLKYDRVLMEEALKLANNTGLDGYQRSLASLIYKFFDKKVKSGKGLKEIYFNPSTGYSSVKELASRAKVKPGEASNWLKKQETYTKHFPINRKHPTRRVITGGIDTQWQADLVEMRQFSKVNNNTNYILSVIDVFSKYAWVYPIKRKTGDEITKAFKKIFEERKPLKLQTDKGSEFINKKTQALLKEEGIEWFTTQNETKAQIVERFNRTLKNRMYKYFTAKNTNKWVDVLSKFVKNYNTSYHRSIKMTPVEASKKKNEGIVRNNLYPLDKKQYKAKFKVGDRVRIDKNKGTFKRGYTPNFTSELFTVTKVLNTNPPTYKIKDDNDEEIIGSFYNEEFSKQLI